MFSITLIPTIPNVEKRFWRASTPDAIVSKDIFLEALSIFSRPLEASPSFKLLFSLSRVDILVLTFASNCLLSNRISTTLSSTVLLMHL